MISKIVQIWEDWNIRGVILFSLSLQFFLIVSAPLRKRTKSFIILFVWLAYLLADWAASFCVGLISKNQSNNPIFSKNDYLMAFWAPFLLLHLGGPDTITAFALEDNELWLRHLLSLIFQALSTAYVFFLTLPDNKLWFPTVLLFLAGISKFGERTYALYLSSINTFRQSMVPEPDPGPNYAKLVEEHTSREQAGLPAQIIIVGELDHGPIEGAQEENNIESHKGDQNLQQVHKAYFFFQKFKGLIVDMIFSFHDRSQSQQYFSKLKAEEALGVIELELNFMYEAFYTKASVVRHWLGVLFRCISFISIVTALALFLEKKHLFNQFDVKVTLALLVGALSLDTMAFFMLIFSDRTAASYQESQKDSYDASRLQLFKTRFVKGFNEKVLVHLLRLRRPRWRKCKKEPYTNYTQLSTPLLYRRWSGSISGYNLLTYCLDTSVPKVPNIDPDGYYVAIAIQRMCFRIVLFVEAAFRKAVKYFGAKDRLEKWSYEASNPFLLELWEFVFDELKRKSTYAEDAETIQRICAARGEWVLQELKLKKEERDKMMLFVDPNDVAFDQSLLLWHIATHLCYHLQDATPSAGGDEQIIDDDAGSGSGEKERDDAQGGSDGEKERGISMILSDYMLYLLIMQPTMMSAVAGIGQIRFQDTCAEAKKFFSKRSLDRRNQKEMKEKACKILLEVPTEHKPIDIKGDRSKSLLFDACRLAKELNKLDPTKKWKVITQVWIEFMSFAATRLGEAVPNQRGPCKAKIDSGQVAQSTHLISFSVQLVEITSRGRKEYCFCQMKTLLLSVFGLGVHLLLEKRSSYLYAFLSIGILYIFIH
ncbi:uncharacterized protein G2W53_002240 [Senna tora]|uniref:DUF4220 domain-containing protein n=1 Tax=Senna tora TaxID=362788 RepID=A0A834XH16_9FABA|nr:uncharacterized protein G2W53_002240 [Senna tora]